MKWVIAWVVVTLALSANPTRAQGDDQAAEEVRALERAWLDAYEKFDVDAMDRIVADDFEITFGDGSRQDKPALVAMLRTPRDAGAPTSRFFTEDVRSRVRGDTVILTGIVVTETTRDGETTQERARYTDTYARRDGGWQVVASHLSNLPAPSPNAEARRWVKGGNTIVSPKNPALSIVVDRSLPYIGRLTFPLKGAAEVERFVFAQGDGAGRVRAVFIAQFESLLPSAKGGYTFAVTDTTRLAGQAYQTDTGFFDFAEAAAARPRAEADRTRAFLTTHGLEVGDDDFLAARYSRITDPAKRSEIILFHYENLAGSGRTRAQLEPGGAHAADTERLLREHEARARTRFEVLAAAP